jgi:hypothetical protein
MRTTIVLPLLASFLAVLGKKQESYEGIYELVEMENATGPYDLPAGNFSMYFTRENEIEFNDLYSFKLTIGNHIMTDVNVIRGGKKDKVDEIQVGQMLTTEMYPGETLYSVEMWFTASFLSCDTIDLNDDELVFAGPDANFTFGLVSKLQRTREKKRKIKGERSASDDTKDGPAHDSLRRVWRAM